MTRRVTAALGSILLVLTASCGSSASSRPEPPTAKASAGAGTAAPKPSGRRVTIHDSDYGRILADGRGRALYLFTKDRAKSRCYGDCARAWPPFITKGKPRAQGKVRQGLLGTAKRTDGRRQVTYNGHPLYYYVGDDEPGEVLCQAVLEYGGYWYVVNRSGDAIK